MPTVMNWRGTMSGVEYRLLEPERLGVEEALFPLSYPLHSPPLLASVREVGLITPLLVQPREGGYAVVCGHRRLQVCRRLGIGRVPCLVLPAPLEDDLQALLLNLHDNLSSRLFNPVEQSIIINRLELFLPVERVVRDYLPLLGLHPHPRVREKLLVLAGLPEPLRAALAAGRMHPEVGYSLSRFEAGERAALFALLQRLRLGTAKQQELIADLQTLARRRRVSIEELLAESEIVQILCDRELSPSQRGEQIRRLVRNRCSPLLSRARQQFAACKKELKIPPRLQLSPPPFFEGEDYRVSFCFRDREQLRRYLQKLEEIAESPLLERMLMLGKRL